MDITSILDEPEHPRRPINALARLQKEAQRMEAITRPLRQWEEMQRHLAPLRQFEEMRRHLAPLRQLEEMQRHLAPLRQLKEIKQRLGPFHKWEAEQKLIASLGHWEQLQKSAGLHAQRLLERHLPITQTELRLREALEVPHLNALRDAVTAHEHIRNATQHEHWFGKFHRQATGGILAQELARQFEYANPALTALAEAQKAFSRIAASLPDVDASLFQFDENAEQAAEDEIGAITEAATAEPTLAASLAQIAAALAAQQNPTVKARLCLFFMWLMATIAAGYIQAIISQQITSSAPQSQPEAVKSIKVAARSAAGSAELLIEYRFVSARAVNIRQNPRARSPKLAELPFGSAVRLLRKEGDFALVVWTDRSSGAEIQGWVFARYLQKFS